MTGVPPEPAETIDVPLTPEEILLLMDALAATIQVRQPDTREHEISQRLAEKLQEFGTRT